MNPQELLLIANTVALLINGGYYYYLTRKHKELNKVKTYAVILRKNKTTETTKEIDPSNKTFEYEHKDHEGTYNVDGQPVEIDNLQLFFYLKGRADPIDITSKENSRLPSEFYDSILKETVTKKLNRSGKGIMDGLTKLTPKQLTIGAAVIFAILYLIQEGGLF